jgi:type II secretory pathway pseudopilin PulG
MKLLKLFLTYQLKDSKPRQKNGGFTLIELLVGLILAFLIITPLLGFMINVMQSDRQEQAKATSEQEIQAALNYIARDLDQAIHVYDGFGLREIRPDLPQYPNSEPVLVFWKRYLYPKTIPTSASGGNCTGANQDRCNDAFVLSLVIYYQIDNSTQNSNCADTTWSCTQQIGRVEIRNGVERNPSTNPLTYWQPPDPGFVLFDTQAGDTVEGQMNDWPPTPPNYTPLPPMNVLVDYIDTTPDANLPSQASCPTTPRSVPRPDQPRFPGRPYINNPPPYTFRQVPDYTAVAPKFQTGSFYACVNSDSTSAQVFIRGNALARLRPRSKPSFYSQGQSAYFPTANTLAKGGGLLSNGNN